MTIVLHHHPFSRAATVVWMLEELGLPYTLTYVDIMTGQQKAPEFLRLNPMGKLPVLQDGNVVVSEVAAIGLYLADRYSLGTLAPSTDDPQRADYLRWSCFAPSVIEPGAMAHMAGWPVKPVQAGWGDYESMLNAMEVAIGRGPFVLGERFTMVDMIFGGTLRYMLRFKLVEPRPSFVQYAERLGARPQLQAAERKNAEIISARGLDKR